MFNNFKFLSKNIFSTELGILTLDFDLKNFNAVISSKGFGFKEIGR